MLFTNVNQHLINDLTLYFIVAKVSNKETRRYSSNIIGALNNVYFLGITLSIFSFIYITAYIIKRLFC